MSQTPTPDLLSDLPECVLFHLLSFLPTKYVVRMSILSRRWRYLWTFVPTLVFNDDLFKLQRVSNGGSEVDVNKRFVDFVNKVLQLHDVSHIQSFRITCFDLDVSYVKEWISAAVKKNVQELVIHTNVNEFPDCIFTCKTLLSLRLVLDRKSLLQLPTSVCLTRLRKLHLFSVTFSGLFAKLLCSCPVLETLLLGGCRWGDGEIVNISSPTSLRIFAMCYGTFSGIKLSNPNLMAFYYSNFFGKNHFLQNLSSLNYANIDVKIDSRYCSMMYKECFYEVSKLLRGVSNAMSLTLSVSTLEQLSNALNLLESLPSFHNINKLVLSSCRKKAHFIVITYLLRSCPILESLAVDMKQLPKYFNNEEAQESKRLCLKGRLDHLKNVKIKSFRGTEDELEFVKLLLSNAGTLEGVVIVEDKGLEKRIEVSEELLLFERASASCIISIS